MRVFVDARVGWGLGIGRYVENVVPRVAALRPQDQFDAHVPADAVAMARSALAGQSNLRVVPVDIAPFSMREQTALRSAAIGYDLTWFTNYWVPLGWRGRYVAVVHDLLHLDTRYFAAPPVRRALSRAVFRKLARSADGLIFISRFTQREFERQFGAPRRAAVIHNGMDHAGWQPFDPENPPLKAKRMLVVGAAKRHKNFQTVLAAWARAQVPDGWTLTIVSPDAKLLSSIDIGAMLNGMANVDIRRDVSDTALRALYGESAIVLMPSLYEGFGLPLLEGLQAGAACVSSTAEALVEIAGGAHLRFVNGEDIEGWAQAITETAAYIDSNAPELPEMRRRDMRHAATFSWDATARATSDLLDQAMR